MDSRRYQSELCRYRMIFDLHTHTRFSRGGREITHAKGTLEQTVEEARNKGLSAIGISNHGPGHITYGMPIAAVEELKRQRDQLQEKYSDIRILIGVEANIIDLSGDLDVSSTQCKQFDYVLAGYHYGIFGKAPCSAALLHGANWMWEASGGRRRLERALQAEEAAREHPVLRGRLIERNTQCMTAAILKNRPTAVTHPGDKMPCDIRAVAKACEIAGTWMEINDSHRDLSVENLRRAAEYDVTFVIGSDAHGPKRAGCFAEGLARLLEAGVDPARVVNIAEKTR